MQDSKVYNSKHEGQAAIVCGSAPCLLDEFNEAWQNTPNAKVIAVNESCSAIRADFLYSYHAEKFSYFKSLSLNSDIKTLTAKGYRTKEEDKEIDYRFDNVVIGATSCGDAIQVAEQMGFNEIIMVGAPMNGCDGYFNDTPLFQDGCHRFGSNGYSKETRQLDINQGLFKKIAKNMPSVKSMSGFTKEILGSPKWQTQI